MTGNVFSRLSEVMKEVEAIGKNQTNQAQRFKFRGIDDVYNTLHPLFSKHGLVMAPKVHSASYKKRQSNNGGLLTLARLLVSYTIYAPDGSSVEVGPVAGEAMDSGDKASNKALAVAHKYALLQLLLVPTNDPENDPDASSHAPQYNAPKSRVNEVANKLNPQRKY